VAHAHEVLHGQEAAAFLDAGYAGVAKREEVVQGLANLVLAKKRLMTMQAAGMSAP